MARPPRSLATRVAIFLGVDFKLTVYGDRPGDEICRSTCLHFYDHAIKQCRSGAKTAFLIISDQDKLIDVGFFEQRRGQYVAAKLDVDAIKRFDIVIQELVVKDGVLLDIKFQIIKRDLTFRSLGCRAFLDHDVLRSWVDFCLGSVSAF